MRRGGRLATGAAASRRDAVPGGTAGPRRPLQAPAGSSRGSRNCQSLPAAPPPPPTAGSGAQRAARPPSRTPRCSPRLPPHPAQRCRRRPACPAGLDRHPSALSPRPGEKEAHLQGEPSGRRFQQKRPECPPGAARHAGTRFHNPIGSNELLKGHSTLPPPHSIAILHSRLRSTSRCSYKETKRPAPRGSLPPPSQLPIPPPHRGRRNAARKRPISAALPTVPAAALPPLTLAAGEGLSVSSQNQQTRYTLNAAPPLVRAPGRPPALYTAGAASFQNHREPSLTGTGEGVGGRGRAPLRGGAEPRSANSRRPRKDTVRARGSRGRLPLLQSSG